MSQVLYFVTGTRDKYDKVSGKDTPYFITGCSCTTKSEIRIYKRTVQYILFIKKCIYSVRLYYCNTLHPQVVIFPPGRKRRSIADWLLQELNRPQVKEAKASTTAPPAASGSNWDGAAEAATVALQLFDSWVQVSASLPDILTL